MIAGTDCTWRPGHDDTELTHEEYNRALYRNVGFQIQNC